MNWKKIREEYPKAFKRFRDSHYGLGAIITGNDCFWETSFRDLYDFFDDNEIHIQIGIDIGIDIGVKVGYAFLIVYDFVHYEKFKTYRSMLYRSRSVAEKAAFIKAFELLENKLK